MIKENLFSGGKDSESFRRKQGKRTLANVKACMVDLTEEIPLLFNSFKQAVEKTNKVLFLLPPLSRSRNLEASIVQSCFAEFLFLNFKDKAKLGKYKRLILNANGYLILFKKLDKKGYPMNIKTSNIQSILNQNQVLDLFSESDYNDEPILYFGYQKDRFGEFVNPQLIYIDEEEIKFSINLTSMEGEINNDTNIAAINPTSIKPKLRNSKIGDLKQAN